MKLEEAQNYYEKYKLIYDEKFAKNLLNEQEYFLNGIELVHEPPFNDTSYEVIVNTIRDGNLIPLKIETAVRNFGDAI